MATLEQPPANRQTNPVVNKVCLVIESVSKYPIHAGESGGDYIPFKASEQGDCVGPGGRIFGGVGGAGIGLTGACQSDMIQVVIRGGQVSER